MNVVLANAASVDPAVAQGASCVFITPRFQASRHVIAMVMKDGKPRLVAKISRDPSGGEALRHEARSLRMIGRFARQHHCPEILQYVAEPVPLLLETFVEGSPVSPGLVRRRPDEMIAAASAWLTALHRDSEHRTDDDWFRRAVFDPLAEFAEVMSGQPDVKALVGETLSIAAPLRELGIPLVMEHGDFSHPNLLLNADGTMGAIDWELSDADGLPLADLYFFLSYVAFARHRARSIDDYRAAFRSAWDVGSGWAWPHVVEAAEQLGVGRAIRPLFVLTWARYVARFAARLSGTVHVSERLDRVVAHRYFYLWRDAVAHIAANSSASSEHRL